MRKTFSARRWLAVLLTLAMCMTLVPTAFAVEGDRAVQPRGTITVEVSLSPISIKTGEKATATAVLKDDNTAVTSQPTFTWESSATDKATVDSSGQVTGVAAGTATIIAKCTYSGTEYSGTATVTVTAATTTPDTITLVNKGSFTIEPTNTSTAEIKVNVTGNSQVQWKVKDYVNGKWGEYGANSDIVLLNPRSNGTTCTVSGRKPGKVLIRAYLDNGAETEEISVEVSGIDVSTEPIEVMENEEKELWPATAYGAAKGITYTANDNYIAMVTGGNKVKGIQVGETTVMVSDDSKKYKANIPVKVVADPSTTIEYKTELKSGEALPFSKLHSDFSSQLGGKVVSVSGLNVPTDQGTLFYRYSSDAEPGAGVASRDTYYRNPRSGQRDLEDITFVAKPDFMGGQVIIKYMALTSEGTTYNCAIILEVTSETGSSAGISINTKYNTAVQFDANEFDRVCKERTGARLSHVVFAQPPTRQGTLYTNYSNSGSYGSIVSTTAQYSLRSLGDIWFVPAPGYTGPVTVYYTARSTGTPGASYAGQVNINVGEDTGVAIGGVSYETSQGAVVYFDDRDFNDYCQERMDDYQTINHLTFDALPSASQGVLYYDYRSASNTGAQVTTGTPYYYGTRNPRIDRLAFVPAEDFVGTVKIPFTAQTINGDVFSGDVLVNVRGGSSSGDVLYTCAPGRSVSFDDTHFNRLCRDLTGSSLNYLEFQSLPSGSDGTLYYNNSTARTNTRYYNGSSTPRIDNLSFRASNSFSGSVNIPFVGRSTSGMTFNGIVTVSSNGSGSSSRESIHYTANSSSAAVFDRDDFDDLSRWETDRDVSSVRFDIPSSSQGWLYRNYRSSSSQGTRISSSTSISASDLDRVAFVPASGYTGTVYIGFKATAASGGGTFEGTVEIDVERAPADATASYSTRTAPVQLNGSDLGRRGYTLSSVRFDAMPSSSAGYLYYQYVSPTKYGRQASTGTSYRVSGSPLISDLSFVPRAGYSGTVSIPYTGTNSNGSTFEGEVIITVSPGYGSTYFNDMNGYSQAQQAAVDFLYDHNITRGLNQGQYGPESHIRRGDFARMVYQAFELSPSGSSNVFYDVPSGAYYAEAVNTLYARGIVSGVGGGYFSPDTALTRQDAICMVQRAMRTVGWSANDGYASALAGYSDSGSVAGYAQGAMAFAVQRGYLPTTGGRLSPTQPLTRVDMAEIIHRVLTY